MKRMHLHVAVDNMQQSVQFNSAIFGASSSVEKADYAKWMLESPQVNFAISARGACCTPVMQTIKVKPGKPKENHGCC